MRDYSKMNKEAKIKAKADFLEKGDTTIYSKAKKIIILCILGIVLAIGSLVFDYLYQSHVISYILDGLLFAFSVIMLIRMTIIRKNEINRFLNKKKK